MATAVDQYDIPDTETLRKWLSKVTDIGRDVGLYVRDKLSTARSESVVSDKINAVDLVTDTDKHAEEVIRSRLEKEFKDEGVTFDFLGEEEASASTTAYSLSSKPTWIVDPVDGTTNFVHRCPQVVVSIGLAINKKPVLGVCYDVGSGDIYTAALGHGAFCNDTKLSVDKVSSLAQGIFSTNVGYQRTPAQASFLADTMANLLAINVRAVRMEGSACLQALHVAAGRHHAFAECGPHPWDVCAAAIIVTEAGGVLRDANGQPFTLTSRRYILACSEAVADECVKCLGKPLPFADSK